MTGLGSSGGVSDEAVSRPRRTPRRTWQWLWHPSCCADDSATASRESFSDGLRHGLMGSCRRDRGTIINIAPGMPGDGDLAGR